ncbi:Lipoprotein LpqB, GerMN domain protein [Desulfotomaculum nigrificans CO-1-SRB]|uniref:Lipoprotein LpqB, GerMN domain protein n=1 Tax=Desulfotomaculum nigrificans (strain DSM 14880 / VKM B-2319 / CO-1-SRB) TaxID=868595 RepID=F6B7T5_DESCC|nr:GerMN domain-containing protein [Desulfotomaculum nigrificans]AEF93457.1 Lipoprotein LpqB, GerMN domain protein [Desulfotomaculum nigrificans CO-1-SRB]
MRKITVSRIVLVFVLILSLLLTGCAAGDKGNKAQDTPKPQAQTEVQTPAKEKVKVTLYFANKEADALVPVQREIDKPKDIVMALINELNNPGDYAPVLPKGTKLLSYEKSGDTITLNFNQAFANLQGTTGELIAINSVVDTITELPEFKKVKILVEGKTLTTGHAVYDQPLTRDESMIKK